MLQLLTGPRSHLKFHFVYSAKMQWGAKRSRCGIQRATGIHACTHLQQAHKLLGKCVKQHVWRRSACFQLIHLLERALSGRSQDFMDSSVQGRLSRISDDCVDVLNRDLLLTLRICDELHEFRSRDAQIAAQQCGKMSLGIAFHVQASRRHFLPDKQHETF